MLVMMHKDDIALDEQGITESILLFGPMLYQSNATISR